MSCNLTIINNKGSITPVVIGIDGKIKAQLIEIMCLDEINIKFFVKKHSNKFIFGHEVDWRPALDESFIEAINNVFKRKDSRARVLRDAVIKDDYELLARTVADICGSSVQTALAVKRSCYYVAFQKGEFYENDEFDIENNFKKCEIKTPQELFLSNLIGGQRVKKSKKIQQVWRVS